jgi:thiol-disulfide isomerase/thioredoxin
MFELTNIIFSMSKKLVIIFICAAIFTGCRNKSVEITGILEDPRPGEYLFLQELKFMNEVVNIDSVIVPADGRFEFQMKVKYPSFYLLKINQNNFLMMVIEPGEKIKMTSHFDSLNYPVTVIGSKGTKLMADYNREVLKTIKKISKLSEIHNLNLNRPDFAYVVDSLQNLANGYLGEINNYAKKFIDENISSLSSMLVIFSQVAPNVNVLNPENDIEYLRKVDSAMYKEYPDYEPIINFHNYAKDMLAYYESKKLSAAGSGEKIEAPEIALPSPEGDTIRLSSTRGSYVLLDFWASWCPPCRVENPNLLKVYNAYHDRGFEIFQVSLDRSKDAWIKGIKDDRLEKWIHVSDVKYWNSVVVPLYGIESIPTNYLLDKDGLIIARNLRGEELQRKLAELFD